MFMKFYSSKVSVKLAHLILLCIENSQQFDS
jgi:hypothetical protein